MEKSFKERELKRKFLLHKHLFMPYSVYQLRLEKQNYSLGYVFISWGVTILILNGKSIQISPEFQFSKSRAGSAILPRASFSHLARLLACVRHVSEENYNNTYCVKHGFCRGGNPSCCCKVAF